MNFDLNTHVISDIIQADLYESLRQDREANEVRREYLGGSILGTECERALQYGYFHTKIDPGREFTGKTYAIFMRGHVWEDQLAKMFNMAGFQLRTHKANQPTKQMGFSLMDGAIKGHIDGCFLEGKGLFETPCLWENKVLKEKNWAKLAKAKVRSAYPVYFAQVQLYMAYMNLTENPALFTALNPSTMEIYSELVPFDQPFAQALSDKGVKVIQACRHGEQLPRIANRESDFRCAWCNWKQRCWESAEVKVESAVCAPDWGVPF